MTTGPAGTATRVPAAISVSVRAPTARKWADASAAVGVSTAAVGTPRACPSVTSDSMVRVENRSAMAALSSSDAAYRAAMVSNIGSENSSGSPSHARIPRHWRGESRQIRTKPSRQPKVG